MKTAELKKLTSDNKRLRKMLTISEQEKHVILDTLFGYHSLSDYNYKFCWVSKDLAQLFDMKPEQICDLHCYTLFNGIDKPCRNCTISKKNASFNMAECSFLGRIWKVCNYPLPGGQKVFSTYTDITDIKTAEKTLLKEKEEQATPLSSFEKIEKNYRTIFKESRHSVLIMTKEGKILDANQACLNILGITKEEINYSNFWDYVLPRDTKCKFVRKMTDDKLLLDFPVKIQRKNGIQLDCLLNFSEKYNYNGNLIGYQGIIQDITERKSLQKEILEIGEQQRRDIGRALHDDLGQLLTGIALKSQFLSQTLQKKQRPEAKEIDRIKVLANKAIDQARELVKGLVPGNLQTNGVLAALEELSYTISKTYGIQCHFQSNLSEANFDNVVADQLYHIAQEAAMNAVKHSKAKRISLQLNKVKGDTILLIEDNGIGFKKKGKPHDGRGIHIMEYRASVIDSIFSIKANNGQGTSVICMLPDTTELNHPLPSTASFSSRVE